MVKLSDYQILVRPITTEKSMRDARINRKYAFVVDIRANKLQVAEAVAEVFDVDVEQVNIIRYIPKFRVIGRNVARTRPAIKKAIITIAEGQRIEEFGV